MSDRDCNRCLYATRDGGCASWDCNFISIAEAEPKRGRWIKWHWYADDSKDSLTEEYKCSECDFPWGETDYNFCPNCGAKMEKEE